MAHVFWVEQVWEVRIWKVDPSNSQRKSMISSSRVTLLCNMPVPDNAKDAAEKLRKHARLWIFSFFDSIIFVVIRKTISKGVLEIQKAILWCFKLYTMVIICCLNGRIQFSMNANGLWFNLSRLYVHGKRKSIMIYES